MVIKKITDYNTDENCYVIYKENCKNCIVIDPGNVQEKLFEFIDNNSLSIETVLLTHCHYDHMSGVMAIKDKTGAKVFASQKCSENILNSVTNVSLMFGENFQYDCVDRILSDGEEFISAGINVKCIYTPGHTNCSVCYLVCGILFSGDTLFLRTTGRWDLPTGNFEELLNSLKNNLYLMDENIKVYPGHGDKTSIGYEKKFNMSIAIQ